MVVASGVTCDTGLVMTRISGTNLSSICPVTCQVCTDEDTAACEAVRFHCTNRIVIGFSVDFKTKKERILVVSHQTILIC